MTAQNGSSVEGGRLPKLKSLKAIRRNGAMAKTHLKNAQREMENTLIKQMFKQLYAELDLYVQEISEELPHRQRARQRAREKLPH